MVHHFKTMTIKRYSDGVQQWQWSPYKEKLWQRNYYEHIIRSDKQLNRAREYILNNPLQWALDENNPDGVNDGGQRKLR